MPNDQPITVSCIPDRNFVKILNSYKHLKEIKKLTLVSCLLISMVPFAWGVSTLLVFVTLVLCLGTLAYIVVSQDQVNSELQRALYSICLKSVAEQVNADDQISPSED